VILLLLLYYNTYFCIDCVNLTVSGPPGPGSREFGRRVKTFGHPWSTIRQQTPRSHTSMKYKLHTLCALIEDKLNFLVEISFATKTNDKEIFGLFPDVWKRFYIVGNDIGLQLKYRCQRPFLQWAVIYSHLWLYLDTNVPHLTTRDPIVPLPLAPVLYINSFHTFQFSIVFK